MEVKNMIGNAKMGVYTRNGEKYNFDFFTVLPVSEKVKFINMVTSLVVGDNYYSVLRDMMFDYAIISVFTDVDTSNIDKSDIPLTLIENLLNETDIVEIVRNNVDYVVLEELSKAVDDNISYLTGIHKNSISESLGNLINTIESKISGIDTENMMETANIIRGLGGEFTMDKMIEAFSKTDMFKDNYRQVLQDKKEHTDNLSLVNNGEK